jgi:metal-sulfur cluster biosynthetic enzyme
VALRDVVDPELGINVVDMSLVYRAAWTVVGIQVALALTTQSCPFREMLLEAARQALRRHSAETRIAVELVWEL